MADTAVAALGRWRSILLSLGVDHRYLTGRHGPCPFQCHPDNGGKDRFRWDNCEDRGTFYCNSCGPGDGLEFAQRWLKVDFAEAARRVDEILETGKTVAEPSKPIKDPRVRLKAIYKESNPMVDGDPVSKYLRSRGLPPVVKRLRTHPGLVYWEKDSDGKWFAEGQYPAMVARIDNLAGEAISLHVTYLAGEAKAAVATPRKVIPAIGGTIKGCAIRLGEAEHKLCVCEGIETALAVYELGNGELAVWAAISAGGMEAIELPGNVKQVIVCADNDKNFRGQLAAYNLAYRLTKGGIAAKIRIANTKGGDFLNDYQEKLSGW